MNIYNNNDLSFDEYRRLEFPHLIYKKNDEEEEEKKEKKNEEEDNNIIYLDHAGATLYSKSQINECQDILLKNTFGNPHTLGPCSDKSTLKINEINTLLYEFFDMSPSDYDIVYTNNTTHSISQIGHTFPMSAKSHLMYLYNCHTSVLGLRHLITHWTCLNDVNMTMTYIIQQMEQVNQQQIQNNNNNNNNIIYNLFVFPGESNFSGLRWNINIINKIKILNNKYIHHNIKWLILYDVAKYTTTSSLHLRHPNPQPHYVILSFYKIFGYPTGIGALFIHKNISNILIKKYFGGGTIDAISSNTNYIRYRNDLSSRLSDGTQNYIGIPLLKPGLLLIQSIGYESIQQHIQYILNYSLTKLKQLKYSNNQSLVQIYGHYNHQTPSTTPKTSIDNNDNEDLFRLNEWGGVIAFNLLDSNNNYIGYSIVQKLASLNNIQIRTGCFCNPGECEYYLNLSDEDIQNNLQEGHVCWDDNDIINGKPTGAIRISFGYMSSILDIDLFIQFLIDNFIHNIIPNNIILNKNESIYYNDIQPTNNNNNNNIILSDIYLYPIKSCGEMKVNRWPMGPSGLLYDREWALIDDNGRAIKQKVCPKMRLIKPMIDIDNNILTITAPNMNDLIISLNDDINIHNNNNNIIKNDDTINIKVCGDHTCGYLYNNDIDNWFTTYLERSCRLVRSTKDGRVKDNNNIKYANEGQYLLISEASVQNLNNAIKNKYINNYENKLIDIKAFRPNFVIKGSIPHEEDEWNYIEMNNNNNNNNNDDSLRFKVVSPCSRCAMINIDPKTGNVNGVALKTLASYRRISSNILFGQFLSLDKIFNNNKYYWIEINCKLNYK